MITSLVPDDGRPFRGPFHGHSAGIPWAFKEALDCLRRAIEIDGTNAVSVANLGCQLVLLGRYTEAIPHLRLALTLNPFFVYPHRFLARILRHQGDEAGAERELERAVEKVQKQIGDYDPGEEATAFARELERNELYGGDSSAIIATKLGGKTWQKKE